MLVARLPCRTGACLSWWDASVDAHIATDCNASPLQLQDEGEDEDIWH